ncbi:cytoplasmic protein, partial [Salmonella enterica subsp. enterica serovar Kentucky]
ERRMLERGPDGMNILKRDKSIRPVTSQL